MSESFHLSKDAGFKVKLLIQFEIFPLKKFFQLSRICQFTLICESVTHREFQLMYIFTHTHTYILFLYIIFGK